MKREFALWTREIVAVVIKRKFGMDARRHQHPRPLSDESHLRDHGERSHALRDQG